MLRLGLTNDVDLAPLFFPLEAGWAATPPGLETKNGTLAELETMLLAGELDIAPIGPSTYANHQKSLFLLPYPVRAFDLAADALFLISNKRLDKYEKPKVAVAPTATTGEVILSVISRNFYSFEPQFIRVSSEISALTALTGEADICVLSGEIGMRSVGPAKGKGYFVEDLTKAWWLYTEMSLPLVLFAVRRAWTEQEANAIQMSRAVMQMFRGGLQQAKDQMPTLTERAEKRTGLPAEALTGHYAAQRYELNQNHLRGLLEFYRRAGQARITPFVEDLEFYPPLVTPAPAPPAPPRRSISEDDLAKIKNGEKPNSRPRPNSASNRAAAQGLRVIKGGKDPATEGEDEDKEDGNDE